MVISHYDAPQVPLGQFDPVVALSVGPLAEHCEVEQAPVEPLSHLFGIAARHVVAQPRARFLEFTQLLCDVAYLIRLRHAQSQLAGKLVVDRAELALDFVCESHQVSCAVAQQAPLVGELDTEAMSDEESRIQLGLKRLERFGKRRLSQVQSCRGTGHILLLRYG